MKKLVVRVTLAFGTILLVSGCRLNPFEPENCRWGTCIKLDLTRSAKLGEESILRMTLSSEVGEPEATLYIQFTAPDVLIDGQPTDEENRTALRQVDLKPRQPLIINANVRFASEGYYVITAHILTKTGGDIFDGFWVHITKDGMTPNPPPERGPGTPGSAIKMDKTPTPRPQTPTRIPPPTQPAYP